MHRKDNKQLTSRKWRNKTSSSSISVKKGAHTHKEKRNKQFHPKQRNILQEWGGETKYET